MRLYYSPGACSLSSHIIVREAGLDVEIEKVVSKGGGKTTEPSGENYLEVNPRGYVPAIKLDSGEVMTEAAAIAQYLGDQAPEKKLAPEKGTKEHYQLLEWLTFISTELHKNFGPAFRKDLSEEEKTKAVDKLKVRIGWVDKALEGKEYLVGNSFSIADAYCFTILRWHPKAGINLTDFPNVQTYYERIALRPMVMKAMEEEGIAK
ncbi:MAG TPA: glutathione transferase GstA [Candidatus Paceibacterota bacterium]|nr:glutathione transferase GstA [Candidatus Paceibacterota bacterium]